MPVERVMKGGRPGYRWGKSGKIYYYKPGDPASRSRAKRKALRQGRAAHARRGR